MTKQSITSLVVEQQLAAMASELFNIGVLRPNGHMLLREGWSAGQIQIAINWLKHENTRGAHIFVRPHGAHALSLIDDLTSDAIADMKRCGFQPALIIETSRNNFQAWLKHGRILDHELSTQAAKELARRFGGDPSSADWKHFGRLAGFTNQKPHRRLENGLAPFVRLRESSARAYSAGEHFLIGVRMLALKARADRDVARLHSSRSVDERIRPLAEFHLDARYGGDLHRADMAWALHAASCGVPIQQISYEIRDTRDLSKKGGASRQLDYAERTANKAVTRVQPLH